MLMLAPVLGLLLAVPSARAIEVEFIPRGNPQIAIWLEDERGEFVDTIMVTRLVGTYGLGNRPGRRDFGSGYHWPYGRREMALPVWAHRRGVEYDLLVFQDCFEDAIRYHNPISSEDRFYCRPTTADENAIDAMTCPTAYFNSCKGMPLRLIDPGRAECAPLFQKLSMKSFYPPRNDLPGAETGYDWPGVAEFANVNDLDAVSAATPPPNVLHRSTLLLPDALASGRYVVWIEVGQEGDFNDHWREDFFPDPAMVQYGVPFIGQPSIVWRAAIEVGDIATSTTTTSYAGYGSVDGSDGELRSPDATITTGAQRLSAINVRFNPTAPCPAPPPVEDLRVTEATESSLALAFTEVEGAKSYEVRYALGAGSLPDEAAFEQAILVPARTIDQLAPDTTYTIAIRSVAECGSTSPLRAIEASTARRISNEVDACFIATAAFGSEDDPTVLTLRRFRDRALMTTELGRAFVELYYQLSPPLAAELRRHDLLRALVRAALLPIAAATSEYAVR